MQKQEMLEFVDFGGWFKTLDIGESGGGHMGREGMEDTQLEQYVTKMMLEMGVPAHLKGYKFLRCSILMAIEDMEVVGSVTKLLYRETAKKCATTEQKVERAIRNAIEVSWTRGNTNTFEELFGYSVLTGSGRPTNSEYIAQIADKISLELRKEIAQVV